MVVIMYRKSYIIVCVNSLPDAFRVEIYDGAASTRVCAFIVGDGGCHNCLSG